jgi:YfiH family protein
MPQSPLLAAANARHNFFTREAGVSTGIYAGRNCGFGSADAQENVARNRALCLADLGVAAMNTVYQVHGIAVAEVIASWTPDDAPRADAMVTRVPGIALGILTADCAPILLADSEAGVIGAAHAGWKGAKAGMPEAVVRAMTRLGAEPARIVAAVGPTIGLASYEVGAEFEAAFLADDPDAMRFFAAEPVVAAQPGQKPHFDLQGFVAARLTALGLAAVERIDGDTCAEPDRYFSYRRSCLLGEPDYGRQISAIALV